MLWRAHPDPSRDSSGYRDHATNAGQSGSEFRLVPFSSVDNSHSGFSVIKKIFISHRILEILLQR